MSKTCLLSQFLGNSNNVKHTLSNAHQSGHLNDMSVKEDPGGLLSHASAIILCSVHDDSVRMLCEHLVKGTCNSYYIYFSGFVSDESLRRVAAADEHNLVASVIEVLVPRLCDSCHHRC